MRFVLTFLKGLQLHPERTEQQGRPPCSLAETDDAGLDRTVRELERRGSPFNFLP